MKRTLLTSVTAFALGVMATVAYTQGKAPAYLLAVVNVKDMEGYNKNFLPDTLKSIKEQGGVYTAGGFDKTTTLLGEKAPNRVVIVKYDSAEAAKKWWDTSGKEGNKIGEKYAEFKAIWLIEGAEMK